MPSPRRYDAVIIGGGHNGLVCASYLAAGGLVRGDIRAPWRRWRRRGHRGVPSRLPQFHRQLHGQPAAPEGNPRSAPRGARVDDRRAAAGQLPAASGRRLPQGRRRACRHAGGSGALFDARCGRVAGILRDARSRRGGFAGTAARDAAQRRRRRRGLAARLEGRPTAEATHRWRSGAICSICSPRVRARCSIAGSSPSRSRRSFGFDAVVGNFASPYTPGSAYVLLHHVFGEVNGKRGQWGHALGGMGAITQAMAREARAAAWRSSPARLWRASYARQAGDGHRAGRRNRGRSGARRRQR